MPILNDPTMENRKLAVSHYGFSAKRIADLGASEYTLVGIAADESGSVYNFKAELEKCIKDVVVACRSSPRANNLMLRLTTFNDSVNEAHGFRPLSECDVDKYTNSVNPGGSTALYDAAVNMLESLTSYGHDLSKQDYSANAIAFVITDGADNVSAATPASLRGQIDQALKSECLESIVTVLVGIATDEDYIKRLASDAGFTQYIMLKDASPSQLAKLAAFVSKSISAQSQALGTGGPSQALTF